MAEIRVIGAGYVGLVTGACLAEMGHTVVCLENDPGRLSRLIDGQMPIFEPGLGDLVSRLRRTGRLSFTNRDDEAIPGAEFIFVTVNTPPGPDGQADVSSVLGAAASVGRYAMPGTILILKSTVPVGTGDRVADLLREARLEMEVVSNPEFLREGSAIRDFFEPDRIVIGADRAEAGAAVMRLYDGIRAPVLHCRRRSAELAKYAANALLATRISFMNEIAGLCDATNADIDEITQIVGADRRIGPHFLKAGLGWGGSCFPKDVQALRATATDHGHHAPILAAVSEVNVGQRLRAFRVVREQLLAGRGTTVAVLGLAFKPGTDDVRNAPALDIIRRLLGEGFRVRAHDPVAMANARDILPLATYAESAYAAATGADVLVLATEWPEYLSLDWRRIRDRVATPVIFDGRNALDAGLLASLGFSYLAFGRTAVGRNAVGERRDDGRWSNRQGARVLARAGRTDR